MDELSEVTETARRSSEVEESGRRIAAALEDGLLAEYGVLDVTRGPYYADPTGLRDSTESIQQAVHDARDARLVAFFPAGRYLVSDTIHCLQETVARDEWPYPGFADAFIHNESLCFPCMLAGPGSGGRATIVLAPKSPGFDDPETPKPVFRFLAQQEHFYPVFLGRSVDIKGKPFFYQSNISFNQEFVNLDLDLGGNPGAAGLDFQAAEGSVIEQVAIDARGAYAGLLRGPGSGGSMCGISVTGGEYGLYLRDGDNGGTQIVALATDLTLIGQSHAAIWFDGRGPLTIAGAWIEGAGLVSHAAQGRYEDGSLSIVDSVIRVQREGAAVVSNRSVYMNQVYVENAPIISRVDGVPELKGNGSGWTHIKEYVAAASVTYPEFVGGGTRQDLVQIGDQPIDASPVLCDVDHNSPAPSAEAIRIHHRPYYGSPWNNSAFANVKSEPYGAKGDGETDDVEAIQRAVDENLAVFLPKGVYRISRPLVLRSGTKLVGAGRVLSTLMPLDSAEFSDTNDVQPLIITADDPNGEAYLASLELRVPVLNPCVYALHWRVGRHSIVRNVYPSRTFWHPDEAGMSHPMIRIDGGGGGSWYTLYQVEWWAQGAGYRHMSVENTTEPLTFYMLDTEHSRSDTMIEMRNARNVRIYAMKGEGNHTVLSMDACRDIRLTGYSGVGNPRPGWSLFRLRDCVDVRLANLHPFYRKPSKWGGLGTSTDPRKWQILVNEARGSDSKVSVQGDQQVAVYAINR